MKYLLTTLAFAGLSTAALAHDYKAGDLTINHPWSRTTPPASAVAVGYLGVVNSGKTPDRLMSASSPSAERVELHETTMTGNVVRMQPVQSLTIDAGQSVELKPNGLHLMFVKPRPRFREGDLVPATLVFERAGAISVQFDVQSSGAMKGMPDHGTHR